MPPNSIDVGTITSVNSGAVNSHSHLGQLL